MSKLAIVMLFLIGCGGTMDQGIECDGTMRLEPVEGCINVERDNNKGVYPFHPDYCDGTPLICISPYVEEDNVSIRETVMNIYQDMKLCFSDVSDFQVDKILIFKGAVPRDINEPDIVGSGWAFFDFFTKDGKPFITSIFKPTFIAHEIGHIEGWQQHVHQHPKWIQCFCEIQRDYETLTEGCREIAMQ